MRETEAEAHAAADRLVSRLDAPTGDAIRTQSLDAQSAGVRRQTELRARQPPTTATSRRTCGRASVGRAAAAGAAIVGDPDQVRAKLAAYRALGIDTFILSGYPHREEAERFGALVLGHPATARGVG